MQELKLTQWPNTPDSPGATAISIQRRLADSRFATRYFSGHGIDVGGGNDSLALYAEFFPLIKDILIYDQPQGDAQYLENIPENTFDFLFSSHCLEHMRDPYISLENWIRVVKPGGHLIIDIPDEDMYEKGHWPSVYNHDHKISFTISKNQSWSPVSINIVDLVKKFDSTTKTLSISTIDLAYRNSIEGHFDQTRTPLAECAIEFIMKKII